MDVSVMSYELLDEVIDPPLPMPTSEALPECRALDGSLARRLARAKARLDRLERDTVSRDHSALASTRVEFSLAARALADDLIARGFHESGDARCDGCFSA